MTLYDQRVSISHCEMVHYPSKLTTHGATSVPFPSKTNNRSASCPELVAEAYRLSMCSMNVSRARSNQSSALPDKDIPYTQYKLLGTNILQKVSPSTNSLLVRETLELLRPILQFFSTYYGKCNSKLPERSQSIPQVHLGKILQLCSYLVTWESIAEAVC